MRQHPWLTLLAVVSTVILSVHLTLEWRAQNAWDRYVTEAQQRGVKLWAQDFVRPPIPDDENFAALPMFQGTDEVPVNPFELTWEKADVPLFANPIRGETMDWVAWQTYCKKQGWVSVPSSDPVKDVLQGLEHFAPGFAQWSEWRTRPQCRFPIDLSPAPGLNAKVVYGSVFASANKVFRLRLTAHLAAGDSSAAWNDFLEARQLYRALQEEPNLIAGLVRISSLSMLCNVVGEGLQKRAWAKTELDHLAEAFDEFHLSKDLDLTMSSGRAFGNQMYEALLAMSAVERGNTLSAFLRFPGPTEDSRGSLNATVLLPRWFFRDNQLESNRYYDALLALLRNGQGELDGRSPVPTARPAESMLKTITLFLARSETTVSAGIVKMHWDLQALLQQTRQAIALERAFLTRGAFPESAAELVPEFLPSVPLDNYSGQPLIYRQIGVRSFSLYSVGSDLRDDGGLISPKVSANRQPDIVWPYAPPP